MLITLEKPFLILFVKISDIALYTQFTNDIDKKTFKDAGLSFLGTNDIKDALGQQRNKVGIKKKKN